MSNVIRFYDARELRVGDKVRVLHEDQCDFYGDDVMCAPDDIQDARKLQENGATLIVTTIEERHEHRYFPRFSDERGVYVEAEDVREEAYSYQLVIVEELESGFELCAHPTFLAPVPGETYVGDLALIQYAVPITIDMAEFARTAQHKAERLGADIDDEVVRE